MPVYARSHVEYGHQESAPSFSASLFSWFCLAVDETFSGRETVREEDASESEGGSAESEDGAAQSEEESSLGPSLKGDGRGGASPSKVYVAPHRRRQGAGTSDARPKAFSLEAIKVEVVRALNRVSEGNAEPVLHQLLRVLQIHAADVGLQLMQSLCFTGCGLGVLLLISVFLSVGCRCRPPCGRRQ